MNNKVENNLCPFYDDNSVNRGKMEIDHPVHASDHTRRFGEIAARMPNISSKVLAEQLKELEADGLINREQYKEIPPRIEYSLIELGKSLRPIMNDMETWGKEKIIDAEEPLTA